MFYIKPKKCGYVWVCLCGHVWLLTQLALAGLSSSSWWWWWWWCGLGVCMVCSESVDSLSGNCCRNLNPLGLTLTFSLSLSLSFWNCPVSLTVPHREAKMRARKRQLRRICTSVPLVSPVWLSLGPVWKHPHLLFSLSRFLYPSLFMELPSITHTSGNTAENAVKWQLCYDMTAKTWWMVSGMI